MNWEKQGRETWNFRWRGIGNENSFQKRATWTVWECLEGWGRRHAHCNFTWGCLEERKGRKLRDCFQPSSQTLPLAGLLLSCWMYSRTSASWHLPCESLPSQLQDWPAASLFQKKDTGSWALLWKCQHFSDLDQVSDGWPVYRFMFIMQA